MEFIQLNESTIKIELENAESYIDENGTAFIEDEITGEVLELPKESLDKNEDKVNLVYKQDDNDLVVELHSTGVQPQGFWKCTLGTVGGTGTGALGGMGIGAVGATPITVLGGGVFGGASGAAASCF